MTAHALEQQFQRLSDDTVHTIQQINQLRRVSERHIHAFEDTLRSHLRQQPFPPSSSYWTLLGDYRASVTLFVAKLAATRQQLRRRIELPGLCSARPLADTEEAWEELVDDLEELRDTLQLQKTHRSLLLLLIDLLDSAERLCQLRTRKTDSRAFRVWLRCLQRDVHAHREALERTLATHGVNEIRPHEGDYPSPEQTRIIARQDLETHDDIIIARCTAPGYTLHSRVLRKADVIVISNPGSAR